MEAIRAEFQALEQALAELRAGITVEYPLGVPPTGMGWSFLQYQAQKMLGEWALALAVEQERAMWAALGKEPPGPGELRPEADLSLPAHSSAALQHRYLRGGGSLDR